MLWFQMVMLEGRAVRSQEGFSPSAVSAGKEKTKPRLGKLGLQGYVKCKLLGHMIPKRSVTWLSLPA